MSFPWLRGRIGKYTFVSAVSQLLVVISAVAIAAVTGPALFGEYSVFLAIVAILSAVVILRFDIVLASARSDAEIVNLIHYYKRVLLVFISLGLILAAAYGFLSQEDPVYLSIIFLSVIITAFTSTASMVALNRGHPAIAGLSRLLFSMFLLPAQITFFYLRYPDALIAGHFVSLVLSCAPSAYVIYKILRYLEGTEQSKKPELRMLIHFSLSGILSQLANNIAIPIVSAAFGSSAAGHFAVANRVLGAPLRLVGDSLITALTAEMASRGRAFRSLFRLTSIAGVGFVLVIALFSISGAERLIPNEWRDAVQLMLILSPVYGARIAAIPATAYINSGRRAGYLVNWEFSRILILVILYAVATNLVFETWNLLLSACWTLAYFALLHYGYRLAAPTKVEA